MVNRTAIIKQPDKISFFNDVYKLQKEYQKALILDKSNPDFIWIGEHHLCYTLGRGSNYDNLLFSLNDDKYDVYKIDRGGEVTCHMPGQLVTYLVLDLKNFNNDLSPRLFKQSARELLLSESSDWSFILRAGTTTELAKERIERHLFRFWKLVEMIKNHSNINLKFLEDIEEEDKVFPNINIDDWRK